jgi:hypothetical protein
MTARNFRLPRILPQPPQRPMPVLVPVPITKRTYRLERADHRTAPAPD